MTDRKYREYGATLCVTLAGHVALRRVEGRADSADGPVMLAVRMRAEAPRADVAGTVMALQSLFSVDTVVEVPAARGPAELVATMHRDVTSTEVYLAIQEALERPYVDVVTVTGPAVDEAEEPPALAA